VVDHPGIVCVRMYNGRPDGIGYDWSSLRLERRWFGLMWSSLLEVPSLFSTRQRYEIENPLIVSYLKGESFRDTFLPSPYEPTRPGIYRVRFRYRLTEQGEEQTVYSETFSIQ